MSLTGNLEDLPLLDIIQIVSFSKKTGFLTIRTAEGEGAIVFHDGFVVSSFTWESPPLDPKANQLPADRRSALVRSRITMALESLIRLREGQFSFSLTTEVPEAVGTRRIAEEILEPGINAQELLLDLARGMDEDRRDSSAALEASFAEDAEEEDIGGLEPEPTSPEAGPVAPAASPPAEVAPPEPELETVPESELEPEPEPQPEPELEPEPEPTAKTLLLVDDEEEIRQTLGRALEEAGYEVVKAGTPNAALKAAQKLRDSRVEFGLVTDLGMPTSGGSSFHGGFEVIKRLGKMKVHPPVLMMTDTISSSLKARARQMGVSHLVFKPGLSKLDPEQYEADLRAFAGKLISDVLPRLGRKAKRPATRRPQASPAAPPPEVSRDLKALQKRLEELRRPADASQISKLVMEFSREFFERGILFLVKDDQVRGLGAFGAGPRDDELNLLVRDIVIPLAEPSFFQRVVSNRTTWSGALPEEKWTHHLIGRIGRFKSATAALLPLVTHRETMALLYGDNPETGSEPTSLDALEVFIDQAGVALEKVFLQRKLQALQPNEPADAER